MQQSAERTGAERRRHRRRKILAVGTINYGRTLIPCLVTNVSRGGAQVRLLDDQPLPREPVKLEVRSLGLHTVSVVWQRGEFAGLKFAVEIAAEPPMQAQAA